MKEPLPNSPLHEVFSNRQREMRWSEEDRIRRKQLRLVQGYIDKLKSIRDSDPEEWIANYVITTAALAILCALGFEVPEP